jgi:putative transposase
VALRVDPRVRLAISRWPDDAPRGAVATFCLEHGISGKSFYEIGKRVRADELAAVLQSRSRRSRSSPSKVSEEVTAQAVAVGAALGASGLDHGPVSVHDKMHAMGLAGVPSTAALAWIFREAGVARLEPKKKPARRGDGSSIRPRTRAGSWRPPSTSSPAQASA